LALSGCTTASDHLYLFPNGSKLDDEIAAARETSLRIQASRGSMSLGESKGGLPPDSVVDTEANILKDSQRLIETYHDPKPGAFVQIVLAPCSPFSVTGELMKQSARLAREYGVHLHTHLAETEDEQAFCLQKFGYRPVPYMQSVDWVGQDVWFAHAVHIDDGEVQTIANHGCGVAHCPSSNMRLASGIAPVKEYLAAGVKVGLGVDGSASNDGSNLLAEVRQALLLARDAIRDEPFLLSWGDIVIEPGQYAALLDDYRRVPSDALLAVNATEDPWQGAAVYVDEHWRVTSLVEKPPRGSSRTPWNNAGIFVFAPLVLDYAERLSPSARGEYELPQAIAAMIADGHDVRAYPVRGFWSDLGRPEDLAAAETALGNAPLSRERE